MTKFFAGVLSVIALGVMLIAYGLLSPRATAFSTTAPFGAPMPVNERVMAPNDVNGFGPYAPYGAAYAGYQGAQAPGYVYADRLAQPTGYVYATNPPAPVVREVQPVRTVAATQAAPRRTVVVERAPRRDWKKTALVIGGSTATGAGIGGAVGGKKGALIGAAIGGGASTLFEATKK
jgi:hypothetical protein